VAAVAAKIDDHAIHNAVLSLRAYDYTGQSWIGKSDVTTIGQVFGIEIICRI
jgi:hypothetical protein